jgi:hypothetical protein
MQIARIRNWKPDDDDQFVHRPVADFEFLCVSLLRLRRAALLAATIPAIKPEMRAAISAYDAALPRMSMLRNVAEHFDDYVLGKGRDKSLTAAEFRSGLQASSLTVTGYRWFDIEVNFDNCLAAAQVLFQAIKSARR